MPCVAVVGTTAVILVSLQFEVVAKAPLKETVLEPGEAPKPVPVIVIGVPIVAYAADSPETQGAGESVYGNELLVCPFEETTKLPADVPSRTFVNIWVLLELKTGPTVPLNVTLIVVPKFEPLIVTF